MRRSLFFLRSASTDTASGVWGCRLLLLGVFAGVMLIFMGSGPAAAQTYTVEEATLNGGGGTVTSDRLRITSSIGGPSPVGTVQSDRYVLYSGVPSPLAGRLAILVIHEPSAEGGAVEAGQDHTVTARIVTNEASLEEATMYYRSGQDTAATEVSMTADGNDFTATIPGTVIGETGFTYYFVASDAEGTTARAPRSGVYSLPVSLEDPGVQKSDGQSGGTTQSAYRLRSMPIVPEEPSPESVLGDDIPSLSSASAYEPSEARLFEPINSRVSEFPRTGDFELGKAFWLIVRDDVDVIDSGAGTVQALDDPIDIDLQQGWNFVGTPFTMPVPIANVHTDGGSSVVLRRYDSEGYNTPDDPVQVMQPFEGYAVYVEEATTLTVEPPISDSEATQQKSLRQSSQYPWRLRVHATNSNGRDTDNVAAVHPDASNKWDAKDWAEPPALFGGLKVAFDAPQGASNDLGLSADVRPELTDGATWPLTVKADAAGPVQLTVDGVEQVPPRFKVWLLDSKTKTQWNLRKRAQARLDFLGDNAERTLRLLVGTEAYIQSTLDAHDAVPQEYVLEPPSPNPSSGPVAVRFGLPTEESVSIAVYNILGQKVAQIRDGETMEPGYHTLTWDERVGSGMYFVRLEAGSFRTVEKMVRVR